MPSDAATPLISATDAAFGYAARPVVTIDALTLSPGTRCGVFGPNGSGKSTLIKGLTGLLRPLTGDVRRAADLRIGYLPQHKAMDLHWPMTGLDAASLAVSARRPLGWLGAAQAQVRAAMDRLDVADLAARPFARLSGGQQQRLLLAGALAAAPQVLLLDEPTDGLDVRSAALLLQALRHEAGRGLCVVLISHDVHDILALADTVAWVHPAEIEGRPSHVELLPPAQFASRITHAGISA